MDAAQARTTKSDLLDRSESGPRISFGIRGLDDILYGGLSAGHLYLLEGTPGAGKTTIAMRLALSNLEAGRRVLYITLSESKQELLAVAASHGWDLGSRADLRAHATGRLAAPGASIFRFQSRRCRTGSAHRSHVQEGGRGASGGHRRRLALRASSAGPRQLPLPAADARAKEFLRGAEMYGAPD